MTLTTFLRQAAGRGIALVVVAGVISGFASSGFVALVNLALHHAPTLWLIMGFVIVIVARIGTNLLAQWASATFMHQSMVTLADRLFRQVLGTPFRTLERIGSARIMTTLTDDVATLTGSIGALSSVITNGAILVGCIGYLAWLSWKAALTLAVFVVLGAAGYQYLQRRIYGAVLETRVLRDAAFQHFRVLTEGIKELKMNRSRRETLADRDFPETLERLRRVSLRAASRYLLADGWAQVLFFALIGFVLFGLPRFGTISNEALTGYAFVALYAMTPIWGIINAVPAFQRGQAAVSRIGELDASLDNATGEPDGTMAFGTPSVGPTIELEQVTFRYDGSPTGPESFVLGPIDLTLRPSELLFIIGGNGSGKSTFVKLLTGLYGADSGAVKVNGEIVTNENRDRYREQFSVIFSDFFLFDRLPTGDHAAVDEEARRYLERLDLSRKVQVVNGVLSTTALSQGQRRRLALLSAYLEDRAVYVFDEWAADQDPAYRRLFYAEILPQLKARGKSVVVITHDDRYFELGDRVIKLEYGRISEVFQPGDSHPAPPIPISSILTELQSVHRGQHVHPPN